MKLLLHNHLKHAVVEFQQARGVDENAPSNDNQAPQVGGGPHLEHFRKQAANDAQKTHGARKQVRGGGQMQQRHTVARVKHVSGAPPVYHVVFFHPDAQQAHDGKGQRQSGEVVHSEPRRRGCVASWATWTMGRVEAHGRDVGELTRSRGRIRWVFCKNSDPPWMQKGKYA